MTPSRVTVRRATPADEAAAWAILEEYHRTFDIAVPDERAALQAYLGGPGAFWLATAGDDVAGCIALRPLPEIGADVCEVKRLYVRPNYRGARIADALLDALEAYAREGATTAIYLDTMAAMHAAARLYERRGYERIPRYNDNPDAAIFMRRLL